LTFFFSRNSIFLSQQFSQNSIFQAVSAKILLAEHDLCPHGIRAASNVTIIEKDREGAADVQPALGGGDDVEARQQKARREM